MVESLICEKNSVRRSRAMWSRISVKLGYLNFFHRIFTEICKSRISVKLG